MANSRITELAPGLVSEAIATDIHLRYNPATGAVTAAFHFQNFITKDGACLDFADARYDAITVDLSEVAERRFGIGVADPVTGLRLDSVSGAGILAMMKVAADTLHNERAAAQAVM